MTADTMNTDTLPTDDRIEAAEWLADLYGHDWSAEHLDADRGRWALCEDTATRYFLDLDTVTAAVRDEVDQMRHDHGHAAGYQHLCDTTDAAQDHQVPADVLDEARELLDFEDGEAVCWGW